MTASLILALAINGLVWGLIIALIALGLSIIFGLLDIINVAHGDFFMLGSVRGPCPDYVTPDRSGWRSFWCLFLAWPLGSWWSA